MVISPILFLWVSSFVVRVISINLALRNIDT